MVGAVGFLEVATDQNKQFSERAPFFRAYLDFIEKFPENEAVYVVVERAAEGPAPAVERWAAAADAIEGALRAIPQHVVKVQARVPVDELGAHGLVFDSFEGVRAAHEGAKGLAPLVRALTAGDEGSAGSLGERAFAVSGDDGPGGQRSRERAAGGGGGVVGACVGWADASG